MICTGFNGHVTMDITGRNMLEIVLTNRFHMDIPEALRFVGEEAVLLGNLIMVLARTRTVMIEDGDTDELAHTVDTFWQFASHTTDYHLIWDEWLHLDLDVNNGWVEMIRSAEPEHLKAPEEVQPDALPDDVLEMSATGQKKRNGGKHT